MSSDRDAFGHDPDETVMRSLLGTLREDVAAPPELRVAVMREIEKQPVSPAARIYDWVLRPRMVPVSPALGGLAVAAAAALIVLWPTPPSVGEQPVAVDQTPTGVVTRFVLVAPGASSVHLTGDFVAWNRDGIALEDLRGTGIWTGDVTLPPGIHQYTFVVDGSQWVPDPRALLQVDDGYGQLNSVVVVEEESET